MPISVTCPECDATYRVADEAAGKAIKCKKCGARVSVPAGGEDEGVGALGNGTDDDAGTDAGAKPKKKGKGKLIAIIGVVLLLLTCCVCTPGGYFGAAYGLKMWPFAGGGGGGGPPIAITVPGEKKDTLRPNDAKVDIGILGMQKAARQYMVKLEQGKKYVIDMKADSKGAPGKMELHDPFLRLLDSKGKQVAANDDTGGLDSQIKYAPPQTGDYTIQASHTMPLPPGGMPYTLTIKLE